MAALRRSCLGMQEERARAGGENKRQERWRWWEDNEKLKCALPWGDLYKWPQIEGVLSGMRIPLTPQQSGVRSVYVPYPVMMRLHWGSRGGGVVSVYGAVEEWLPGVELRDESQTGILFCQLECANGNVRAAGKLMNLIGEMPPLSPNAWSIAIVSAGRQCFSLLFFDCFLRLAWLFCGYEFDGELWVEEIKESIRDRDQCFHLLLTSAGPAKSDFGLEFSNSVSKVNINKRGCAMQPPQTIWLPLPRITAENVNSVLFISI